MRWTGEGRIPMVELGAGNSHTVPLYNKKGDKTGTFKFTAKEDGPGEVWLCQCSYALPAWQSLFAASFF